MRIDRISGLTWVWILEFPAIWEYREGSTFQQYKEENDYSVSLQSELLQSLREGS